MMGKRRSLLLLTCVSNGISFSLLAWKGPYHDYRGWVMAAGARIQSGTFIVPAVPFAYA